MESLITRAYLYDILKPWPNMRNQAQQWGFYTLFLRLFQRRLSYLSETSDPSLSLHNDTFTKPFVNFFGAIFLT